MKKKIINTAIWYEMNANKYFNKHYGNRVNRSLYEPPKYTYPRKRKKMSL